MLTFMKKNIFKMAANIDIVNITYPCLLRRLKVQHLKLLHAKDYGQVNPCLFLLPFE